jgi:iron complex outermembrane receptor protein
MQRTQVGFRIDRGVADGLLTVQSDYSTHDLGDKLQWPAASLQKTAEVGNVSAHWQRRVSAGTWDVRTFYSYAERGAPADWDDSSTGIESQFNAERIGRHLLTAGVGYRYTSDQLHDPSTTLAIEPARVGQSQWSLYGQDQIHFFDDNVRMTLGAKLEDLRYTGLAFQPTLRGLWRINDSQTVWAAASRAVRTPSRTELHAQVMYGAYTPTGLLMLRTYGNPDLDAEKLDAYEFGWRWRPYQKLSFDIAAYRNEYRDLIDGELINQSYELVPEPAYVVTRRFANVDTARIQGVELVAELMPTTWMRCNAQANFLDDGMSALSIDPRHSYSLRAQFDLPHRLQVDLDWHAVSELKEFSVPGYDVLGLRLAWNGLSNLEFALHIDNALDHEHVEFVDEMAVAPGAKIGRSVLFRATWRPRN